MLDKTRVQIENYLMWPNIAHAYCKYSTMQEQKGERGFLVSA